MGTQKYLWWGKRHADGSYDYTAWGAQGESIFVSPQARVVIVRFGVDAGAAGSWFEVFENVTNAVQANGD